MLKFFLISIVIVPTLLGVKAATRRSAPRGLPILVVALVLYGVLWMGLLYYLKRRWVG